jgi:hypothetical protein
MYGLLTKSRELGLRPQTGSRFTHVRGPFASSEWVPKNLIIVAFRGYAKVSPYKLRSLTFLLP